MDRNEFIDLIFKKGKENSLTEMEVYTAKESTFSFNIYKGNIERFVVSEEENLSLTAVYNNKVGYSYTEKLALENIDELVDNLIQYAKNNNKEPMESQEKSFAKPSFTSHRNSLNKKTDQQKIEYMLDIEKRTYALNDKVSDISQCSYTEKTKKITIENDLGLNLTDSHSMGIIGLRVVAKSGNRMETGQSHHVFSDLVEDYKDKIIKESVIDAVGMLEAKSMAAGNYKTILRNNVAADLFSSFAPIFSSSLVQKGLSLLRGKSKLQIATSKLSIIDDPLMECGKIYRHFDDEGTPTFRKYLIQNGTLENFLYDKRTALIDKVQSTGNGFKESHKSSIGVSPTNMYIEKGDKDLEELITEMHEGVVIINIEGLHAGINPNSGDFSLSADGYYVKEGKIKYPLTHITVAGNIFSLMMNIERIGNDIKFSNPYSNYFGSPSLVVKTLSISGKSQN